MLVSVCMLADQEQETEEQKCQTESSIQRLSPRERLRVYLELRNVLIRVRLCH